MHWASAAAICWMSSTVLTRRDTKVSVMFLRIWACSCRLASGSAATAGACSDCGQQAQEALSGQRAAPPAVRAGATQAVSAITKRAVAQALFLREQKGLSQDSSHRVCIGVGEPTGGDGGEQRLF